MQCSAHTARVCSVVHSGNTNLKNKMAKHKWWLRAESTRKERLQSINNPAIFLKGNVGYFYLINTWTKWYQSKHVFMYCELYEALNIILIKALYHQSPLAKVEAQKGWMGRQVTVTCPWVQGGITSRLKNNMCIDRGHTCVLRLLLKAVPDY